MAGLVAVQLKQKRLKYAPGIKGDQIIENEPEDAKVNNLQNVQTYSLSTNEVKYLFLPSSSLFCFML